MSFNPPLFFLDRPDFGQCNKPSIALRSICVYLVSMFRMPSISQSFILKVYEDLRKHKLISVSGTGWHSLPYNIEDVITIIISVLTSSISTDAHNKYKDYRLLKCKYVIKGIFPKDVVINEKQKENITNYANKYISENQDKWDEYRLKEFNCIESNSELPNFPNFPDLKLKISPDYFYSFVLFLIYVIKFPYLFMEYLEDVIIIKNLPCAFVIFDGKKYFFDSTDDESLYWELLHNPVTEEIHIKPQFLYALNDFGYGENCINSLRTKLTNALPEDFLIKHRNYLPKNLREEIEKQTKKGD